MRQLPDNSWVLLPPFMMLLLAYESEISLGFRREVLDYDREVSRLWSRSFSITIEKFLDYDREVSDYDREVSDYDREVSDYDREVSRLRSRSVSITIEKFLDYDREDSRLRSRRFSKRLSTKFSTTVIEKFLNREGYW